uniref:MAM domain-containing protein n=1 Tax=Cyprinus carpio TaxID=7962 RepID=A0A8C2EF89_CYPCA
MTHHLDIFMSGKILGLNGLILCIFHCFQKETDDTVNEMCFFTPACSISCDFEKDICAWTQLATDVFDWTRHRGSTPTSMTGPSSDHTTGSGFYLYIEGDSVTHGDTARLLSAECAEPQPQCLQFWYHMYGSSWTMGMSVYLLQYGNVAKEVWRKREDQGNMWHLARVDLRPDAKFQVIFEGRRGSSARSDVAIDDVSLHRGACNGMFLLCKNIQL